MMNMLTLPFAVSKNGTGLIKTVFHMFFRLISTAINIFMSNILLFGGILLLLIIILLVTRHNKPIKQAKKAQKRAIKREQKLQKRNPNYQPQQDVQRVENQAEVTQQDVNNLIYSCNMVIQALDQRIQRESGTSNTRALSDLRAHYYETFTEIRDHRPVKYKPQLLIDQYQDNYDDSTSELYGRMESFAYLYDRTFGTEYFF